MADKMLIEPDLQFIRDVGSDDMQKCYQCATCATICPITPDVNPFPRKEMIWAQWGLKDRLLNDPDIWLCHNCNDCSTNCPRGGRPGDLLAALRNYFYKAYAFPSFMGQALASPAYLPLLMAIPAVLILMLIGINGTLVYPFPLTEVGKIEYREMIPGLNVIDPLFMGAVIFVLFSLGISVSKFWQSLNGAEPGRPGKGMPIINAIIATIVEILTHSRFDQCGQAKQRSTSHKMLIYSFIALAIVTGIVALFEWMEILHHWGLESIPIVHFMLTPLNLLNPVKILANIGAVMLLYGVFTAIKNRQSDIDGERYGKTTYQDWYLLYTILTIVVTGIGAEVLRLANIAVVAYPVYFCHLIAVFMLIAYLPFGKFGHIVYRTVAIIHSKHTGRYELTAEDVA